MNGKNGNVIESYYSRRKTDWSLIFAGCTLILALLAVIYYALEKITDLKIENTNLKFRNELLNQSNERKYAPDGYR